MFIACIPITYQTRGTTRLNDLVEDGLRTAYTAEDLSVGICEQVVGGLVGHGCTKKIGLHADTSGLELHLDTHTPS